jgi:hypothetical protein
MVKTIMEDIMEVLEVVVVALVVEIVMAEEITIIIMKIVL